MQKATHNKKNKVTNIKITNKRARFDFDIEQTYEAGIVLFGSEVKSVRTGKASINEAFVCEMSVDGNPALCLVNSNISEYSGANIFNHEPKRARKLLLRKKQMNKLLGDVRKKGISIVPIQMYFNSRGLLKLEIGAGKGRKTFDKRELLKERDWNRDKAKILKNNDY